MLKKFLRLIFWLIFALVLLGACWLVSLNYDLPLWSVPLLFISACLLLLACDLGWRKLTAWRLRRKLEHGTRDTVRKTDHRALDTQWKLGLKNLRGSRSGAGPAQELPWLIRLNLTPDANDGAPEALAVKRLFGNQDSEDRSAGFAWLFLRNSVQIDVGADMLSAHPDARDSSWHRLLYWLMRLRRNEPLNGIILQLSVAHVLQADDRELLDLGRAARERVDELAGVMNARAPVWIVLSGLQEIEGGSAWLDCLDPALHQEAFGHTQQADAGGEGASQFLRNAWDSIRQRLFEIRIGQAAQRTLPPEVFRFPQAIDALEPRLRTFLVPAFEPTPYAPGIMLRGLYFTHLRESGRGASHAFATGLYDQVLPGQRDGWEALERWRTTRRLLRQAAVAAWLLCCAGVLALLVHSWHDVDRELEYLASRSLNTVQFENANFELDLQNLNSWRDSTLRLFDQRTGWQRLQPYSSHLERLATHYQATFARFYRREVLFHELDPLLHDAMPVSIARGSAQEIAVWAQHLVRRINLLKARLASESLDRLPLPGPEMDALFALRNQHGINLQTGILIGQLYRDYLRWQPDRARLQAELDTLQTALMQLGLGSRSPEWLLAWAEFQGDIQPITLADFWNIRPAADAPVISAGLTHEGIRAITRFGGEIAQASNDGNLWEQRYQDFSTRFQAIELDAWVRFLTAFPEARKQLPDEGAWKNTLASLFTNNDPHLRVLQRISAIVRQMPMQNRPAWASAAIELEQLLLSTQKKGGLGGLITQLSLTNAAGSAQLQAYTQGLTNSIVEGVGHVQGTLGMAETMQQYREQIAAAVQPMLEGNGKAADFAARTWRFGHDPAVAESPLHSAQQHVDILWKQLAEGRSVHPALLGILRGPLAYAQEFAARAATCTLEKDWQTSVVGALHSIENPQLAEDILYGERGQLNAFLSGLAASFVERDATRYLPRETLGMSLPLHGQFYAFASGNQLRQVTRAARRLEQERSQKQQELTLGELDRQAAELEKQLSELQANTLHVRLRSLAPLVNPDSRALPRRSRVTLQCAQNPQMLDNYNFPSQAEFSWNASTCSSTEISIEFPDFTLRRSYPGPYGFFRFLEEFSQGRKQFTGHDFPDTIDAMFRTGLESVAFGWQIEGYQNAIETGRAIQSVSKALEKTKEDARRIKQQMGQLYEEPTGDSGDALSRVPRNIADPCWQPVRPQTTPPAKLPVTLANDMAPTPVSASMGTAAAHPGIAPPVTTAVRSDTTIASAKPSSKRPPDDERNSAPGGSSSEKGQWRLQVGLFGNPEKARTILNGLEVRFEETAIVSGNGKPLTRIFAVGYESKSDAQHDAGRIAQAMGARPLLLAPQSH